MQVPTHAICVVAEPWSRLFTCRFGYFGAPLATFLGVLLGRPWLFLVYCFCILGYVLGVLLWDLVRFLGVLFGRPWRFLVYVFGILVYVLGVFVWGSVRFLGVLFGRPWFILVSFFVSWCMILVYFWGGLVHLGALEPTKYTNKCWVS